MQIILLNSDHWQAFRQMRIHALKTEPDMLYGSWEQVARKPEKYWTDILSDKKSQVFGLVNEGKMVGTSTVLPHLGDDLKDAAYLCWAYVLPKFRGGGHGRLLTSVRLDWIRQSKDYKAACVICRDTNIQSQKIYDRLGFKYSHTIKTQYAQGEVDEYVYVMDMDEQ